MATSILNELLKHVNYLEINSKLTWRSYCLLLFFMILGEVTIAMR